MALAFRADKKIEMKMKWKILRAQTSLGMPSALTSTSFSITGLYIILHPNISLQVTMAMVHALMGRRTQKNARISALGSLQSTFFIAQRPQNLSPIISHTFSSPPRSEWYSPLLRSARLLEGRYTRRRYACWIFCVICETWLAASLAVHLAMSYAALPPVYLLLHQLLNFFFLLWPVLCRPTIRPAYQFVSPRFRSS